MEDSRNDKELFYHHISEAKSYLKDAKYHDSLKAYSKALEIKYSEKLAKKIKKLKEFIEELGSSDDDDTDEYEVIDGLRIYRTLWNKLYWYQKNGVKWLWRLFCEKKGGILGDDMGLGKTIQIIAFLAGMFDDSFIKNAIIVMPVSLLPNWKREFEKWAPGIRVCEYHGPKAKREKELMKIQKKNGVILTTYGMIVSSHERIGQCENERFVWDYIILDEGQKIKNASKTSKCARAIPARNRFILSGTPIQNNLKELWSLVDFVTEGRLLGTLKTFKTEFENPIVRARERDATNYEKNMGNKISESLRNMLAPFFLRRTKLEVFGDKQNENHDDVDSIEKPMKIEKMENTPCQKNIFQLSKKTDLIIWLFLSEIQLEIYKNFLNLDSVREAISSTRSPLADLTMLKKISDHPRLLSNAFCDSLGLGTNIKESEEVLLNESSKLLFTLKLVANLKENGHRTLIFSQSRKMLDIVDRVLTREGIRLLRFDGRITDSAERQELISKFQNDISYSCCLLTTQVGSVGLNMTGADRVIIFDPSWNPGSDAQAVDRAYRIGQMKDVVIYRLITCGTIEEKILRKQIFKNAISQQTTGASKNPYRYFARHELRELFELEDPRISITHDILEELHGRRALDPIMAQHYEFIQSLGIYGISDHGLVYSAEAANVEENEADDHHLALQIQERVKRAQELVLSEAISQLSLETKSKDISQTSVSHPKAPREIHVKESQDIQNSEPNTPIIRQYTSNLSPSSDNEIPSSQQWNSPKEHSVSQEIDDLMIPQSPSDDYDVNTPRITSTLLHEGENVLHSSPDDEGLFTSLTSSVPGSASSDHVINKSDTAENGVSFTSNASNLIVDETILLSDASAILEPDLAINDSMEVMYASDVNIKESIPNAGASVEDLEEPNFHSSIYDGLVRDSIASINVSNSTSDQPSDIESKNSSLPLKNSLTELETLDESSFIEVIDEACSPLQIIASPNDHQLVKGAASYVDDCAKSNNTSLESFVEVVDMACSPIDSQSNNQKFRPTMSLTSRPTANSESLYQPHDDLEISTIASDDKSCSIPTSPCSKDSSIAISTDRVSLNESNKNDDSVWNANATTESKGKQESQFTGSESLFSNSLITDGYKTDSPLGNSLPTQPVPEGLENFSEPSESSCSFILDPGAQEADTLLINQTSDLYSMNERVMIASGDKHDHESVTRVSIINDGTKEKETESNALENPFAYRSLKIVESDSDHDTVDEDDTDQEIDSKSRNSVRDPQETDTLQISEPDSVSPLVVWDKPFYKRAPGKRTRYSPDSFEEMQMADTVPVLNESIQWQLETSALQNDQETRFECPTGKHRLKNINITSCECVLSTEDQDNYHKYIENAEHQITRGYEMIAIEYYLQALKITDYDPKIQHAACSLVRKLCP